MVTRDNTQLIPADILRDCIANALAIHVKSYNIPGLCEKLGLKSGDSDEAQRSKRQYVKSRLMAFEQHDLLRIAVNLLKEVEDAALSDKVSEMTVHAEYRITDITRRDVLKVLNDYGALFGDSDLFDGLNIISSKQLSNEYSDGFCEFLSPLAIDINKHYIQNDDYSNEELLIKCGALECSQTRFFALLEKLLDPVIRRGDEQAQLATALNSVLKADGFNVVVVGDISAHSIFAVRRMASGVIGTPKNLIFASINAKPDLYFTDAINNDIAIRNDTDALIYNRFLTESGLLWETLAEWWQDQEGINDPIVAKRTLYQRLLASVKATSSPGEFTLFDTYYREFVDVLGNQLPALIPQVYLHYDPRTMKQRGHNLVLLRQRIDLLLLLDRNVRIVIEVDGKQHYADGDIASTTKYGELVAEDRRLRLAGYELYRFGGGEFKGAVFSDGKYTIGQVAKQVAVDFFKQLFEKHHIKPQ